MKCPGCGSDKIIKGRIFNQTDYIAPQAFFRPNELKPFALFGIHVRIKKNKFSACGECGLIWSAMDAAELNKVVAKNGRKNIKAILGITENQDKEV